MKEDEDFDLFGFEEKIRQQVWEQVKSDPSVVTGFIQLKNKLTAEKIENSTDTGALYNVIKDLERSIPLHAAAAECPFYPFRPPVELERAEWKNLDTLNGTGALELEHLYENGFSPINLKELECTTSMTLPSLKKNEYGLIDLDYGLIMWRDERGRVRNYPLDTQMLARYTKVNRVFLNDPVRILDVGCERGHAFFNGDNKIHNDVLKIEVNSRGELEGIINKLSNNLSRSPEYTMWFRGQPSEYLLGDFTSPEYRQTVPWRCVQEFSLYPSLCRNYLNKVSNFRVYAERLLELKKYCQFAKEYLGIPTFETRRIGQEIIEKLHGKWGHYSGGMTSTLEMGNKEVEHHDTHIGFQALQASLFLQHYGLDSSILDITNSIDTALFFAQNKIIDGKYCKVDVGGTSPVIYVFILHKELDLFLDSSKLQEAHNLLRPIRQNCGILAGASIINRNYYARFVAIKIILNETISSSIDDASTLFPCNEEDHFAKALSDFSTATNMKYLKPFIL